LDSVVADGGVLGSPARTDSNRSRYGVDGALPMPHVRESSVLEPQHLPGSTAPSDGSRKLPSWLGRERTMNDGFRGVSVYTQNSWLSTLSQYAVALFS